MGADTSRPSVSILPIKVRDSIASVRGVTVRNGGFGSAISRGPDGQLYILTDRGPNYDFAEETKAFAAPDVGPQVGVFERRAKALTLLRRIRLRNVDGSLITGLPHPPGPGSTGEVAVSPDGTRLDTDPNGLDTEGIHVLRDGSFWIADEYGPNLVHFDAAGREIERVSPFGPRGRALPAVLARRRPNYGFEGLTGDETGRLIVGIVQSPLDNPRAAGRESIHVRIVMFDTQTGSTRQYLYPLDAAGFLATDIAWLSPTRFLVLERDVGFPGGDPAGLQKKVFAVDLTEATDVSDSADRPSGRLANGKTLEAASTADLVVETIEPASKTLVVDLLDFGYPHDKPEGLVVLGRDEIGVVNDDDYSIASGGGGVAALKRLPRTGEVDAGFLWVIRLTTPLW
jgi:phytase-like protein